MRTTVGQPFNQANVEEDIRSLYGTGDITNVRIFSEPVSDGVKVIVIVATRATIKDIVFQGNAHALRPRAPAQAHHQERPRPQRGNRRVATARSSWTTTRQGLRRRGHQDQHRHGRHRQHGRRHLHGQRGRQEQPASACISRATRHIKTARAAPRHEGHARQDDRLLHRQERPARPEQAARRPRQHARALPEQGLHRHRHPRDPHPAR